MVNIHSFLTSQRHEGPFNTEGNPELNRRLGLYQVFLKLYDQHRGLLDEILNLEHSSNRLLGNAALPYVQGAIIEEQAHLVTNLVRGRTQAFMQPQNIWTIGRDSRRVLLPIQDSRLSRCHAAIRYVERWGFQLLDMGSSNGSFVNGELVKHGTWLQDGDRIRLGSLTFTFSLCQCTQTLDHLPDEQLAQIQEIEQFFRTHQDRALPFGAESSTLSEISKTTVGKSLEDTLLFIKNPPRNPCL